MKEITRSIYDNTVICYERDDVIDRLFFTSEEKKLICLDIINSIESTAAEFLKDGKPAFLPFTGTYGLHPGLVGQFNNRAYLHKVRKDIYDNKITPEEGKLISKGIYDKSMDNMNTIQNYYDSLRSVRALNKKAYIRIINKKGIKYAEKYIERLASFVVVEFNQEIEDLYNNLENED